MSFFRKTLFWIIALVVLSGAFFLVNDRVDEADRAAEADLRLFPFEPEAVAGFWIERKQNGLQIRLARGEAGWRLRQPVEAKADDEAVGKLLGHVVKTKKDAVLFDAPTPEKLEELGLGDPQLEMGFRAGELSTVIRFGAVGPTHNIAYAMLAGDPKVYRVHSDVRKEAEVTVHALRDKTVLSFDPTKLQRLTLERRGQDRVSIRHDAQGRWDMIEPERTRASMLRVLETLYEIKNAAVKAFVDERPADLTPYGLEEPRIQVSILEQGAAAPLRLSVGAKDRTRRGYFAKTGRDERVFLLEESLVNALSADRTRWHEKGADG